MNVFVETERLLLRELLPSDLEGMFELDSDPRVHQFLGNRPVTEKRQSLEMIEYVRRQYVEHGIGRWAVAEKATGQFMGWCGFKLVKDRINGRTDYYDLGYRFIQRYWGQGYASESARAALNYGFESLRLEEIIGAAQVANQASNRILQKLGFRLMEEFTYDHAVCNWYELKRRDWEDLIAAGT